MGIRRQGAMISMCRGAGLLLAIGISMLYILPAQGAGSDAQPFADLGQIKKFVAVEVQVQGTAEKLGLNGGDLTDSTRVTFLKKFPGVALEMTSTPSPDAKERLSQLGYLTCEVWTVGEEYIVAYHLDCNAGSYFMPGRPDTLWNRAILGYGPKGEVSDAVREGLQSMVEQLAVTYYKVRAEVSPQ